MKTDLLPQRCASKLTASVLLGASLLWGAADSFGQGRLQQGFETTTNDGELLFTKPNPNDPGQVYSGKFNSSNLGSSNQASHRNSNVFSEGSSSYGIGNNTGNNNYYTTTTLEFAPVQFANRTTGNYLSFRIASLATNAGGGIDNTAQNGIDVNVRYNGSSTWTPVLRIEGQNATGTTFDFSTPGEYYVNPVGIPNQVERVSLSATNAASFFRINFNNSGNGNGNNTTIISQVEVQIKLSANNKTAIFLDDVSIGSSGPLPVELTSFSGARQAGAVLLKWATAQEKNNDRFEVQRSSDGQDFATIANVRGSGNTVTPTAYEARDAQPLKGTAYYRPRQVDTDGTDTYSRIITVRGDKPQLLLTPNPVISQLHIQVGGTAPQWRILTHTGQVIRQGHSEASTSVDVSDLKAGLYYFEVLTDSQRTVERFSKQ